MPSIKENSDRLSVFWPENFRINALAVLLSQAGAYLNPERPEDIALALGELIESQQTLTELTRAIYVRVQEYAWLRCADRKLRFLVGVEQERKKGTTDV